MKRTLCAAFFVASLVQPVSAKTLVFCSEGSPEALNPQLATTTTGMNASRPIFNGLVEFKAGSTEILPALAESWTISGDGTVYTFRLRENVKFHSNREFKPTRAMNADDVLFSLMRQWKKDHPFHNVSGAHYDYFKDMGIEKLLRSIEKVDERTVRITLNSPEAPFLANMAMPFNVIHSAEYADQMLRAAAPERLDREPIGTGPYAFAGYQKDIAVRYRAFADYWKGRQPIDTLVFSITPNPAVRLTKLKAGECHVMAFPNPGDARDIEHNASLKLLQQEGLNVGYLAINTRRPPFDDPRVRRALNMAIDKASIVTNVYRGAGAVAKNPIPPTLWSYNDAIKDYAYDPGGAQRLLNEAGRGNGFETELWYMPVSRPYASDSRRAAEMIQADLARIGVRVTLKTAEWGAYRNALQAGETDLALFGWTGDNGDPDNFLNVLLGCEAARSGGNNIAKWCDKDYDALVQRARQTITQSDRADLYRKAQEVFNREAPWVTLAHSVVFMATRREVSGFVMDPLGRHLFEGVDIAE
ncbi:periplasmic dipeptide transport protein precursor [Variibacter gotjawalensis]|uniref:Periplasmic dipeptide transport protein n=1 Tax=Variibacter gotjawalensis TaxID=1333996 RepID=A0A0S3PR17_9BRAD|nr:ABC transporter substrate-binding protein [Variibacter gotjawalensis]NIK48622.1 dipeptide transport system substrate-binding protein [Variibacter gotjawalensis]RZS50486.1 dipeptide transport system substrate-binding protein [Variibacter gotjawalensis]BAT58320.1 periplasmic dipeptide transport protein precursor [Variibacter gotjawalensis]